MTAKSQMNSLVKAKQQEKLVQQQEKLVQQQEKLVQEKEKLVQEKEKLVQLQEKLVQQLEQEPVIVIQEITSPSIPVRAHHMTDNDYIQSRNPIEAPPQNVTLPNVGEKSRMRKKPRRRPMKDRGIQNGEVIRAVRSHWDGINESDDWVWEGTANTDNNTITRNGKSYKRTEFGEAFHTSLSSRNIKVGDAGGYIWTHLRVKRNGVWQKVHNINKP